MDGNKRFLRIILFFLFLTFATITSKAQIVINSQYKPYTFNEIMLQAKVQAARNAYNEKKFKEYSNEAYEAYNRGDKYGFITYTNYALETGWYNAKMYYDRGQVFQSLGDMKNAKREYKKAKKHGYYQAEIALNQLKNLKKKKKYLND